MNNQINDTLTLAVMLILLPILTYFIVKFGATGFYSAKRIWDKSSQKNKDNQTGQDDKE